MKPKDIDATKFFLATKLNKFEPEDLARHIVRMAQFAGDWVWFTKSDLLESFPADIEWLEWCWGWIDELDLIKIEDSYFPSITFFAFLEQFRVGLTRAEIK